MSIRSMWSKLLFSPKDDAGSDAALEREAASLRQAEGADDEETTRGSGDAVESIADAGRKFLEGLSGEERDREFTEDEIEGRGAKDDDADADNPEDGDEELERQRRAGADVENSDDDEPILREEDGAEWKKVGNTWRWVKDGKFATGEAPDGWEEPKAPAPKAGTDKTDKGKEKPDAAAPKLTKVTLAGESDRGEEDIEVEVDEEIAERIRRAQKGAMRRQQFERRKSELDARAAEMDAVELELTEDPVGFIVSQLSDARRLDVARALLVQHLPELKDVVEQYLEDETARLREQLKLKDQMSESSDRLDRARQVRAYAQKCMAAAEALIPEDVDDDVAQEFIADARRVLHEAAQAGTRVTPETVKEILARRLKLYGFDQSRRTPAPRPRSEASRGRQDDARTARPLSQRARDVAERRPPSKAEAAATQSRIRRVQQSRTAAVRQAPAGAGAAPTQVPLLKSEEETDVRSASAALRKRGLPDSWTSAQQ
jgi:hypothetical protein